MPSSDYNKYLAAIKAANDMENKELLRQIKNELIANYGLMDDDVDYLLRQYFLPYRLRFSFWRRRRSLR